MKKQLYFLALLCAATFFMLPSSSIAQAPSCSGSVISGCLGECGSIFLGVHTVTRSDVDNSVGGGVAQFCVEGTFNSLCPNQIGIVRVFVNNTLKYTGDNSTGYGGQFNAKAGDFIRVTGELGTGDPRVLCIRQGETGFNIGLRAR